MKIQDYLHLYIGCPVRVSDMDGCTFDDRLESVHHDKAGIRFGIYEFGDMSIEDFEAGNGYIKPLLRPLSDMTEEEENHIALELKAGTLNAPVLRWQHVEPWTLLQLTPDILHYLLSKHFDLFGLIDAGLALPRLLNS